MKRFILLTSIVFLILPLTAALAGSEQTYTNKDLERYRGEDTGAVAPEAAPQVPKKESRASKATDERSKKYWCSRGSVLTTKVDRAKEKVRDAEQKLADTDDLAVTKMKNGSSQKRRESAEKKVRSAKKELYRAEHSLEALEQDAHRQNIPPGWLRCQFTY